MVLTSERDKKQSLIHFVSISLQGLELNYLIFGKLVVALIMQPGDSYATFNLTRLRF